MAANTLLHRRPEPTGETHVHLPPPWLPLLLRLVFGVFGVVVLLLAFRDGAEMPLFAQGLCAILVPSFLFGALSSKVWRFPVEFIADQRGIFIPAGRYYGKEGSEEEQWLLIPWANVENIRIGRPDDTESSRGIGFDLHVTDEERDVFLSSLYRLTDHPPLAGCCSVAFTNALPSQERTRKKLLTLKNNHG